MTGVAAAPYRRLNGPCSWGTPAGPCGRPSRPYPCGPRCDEHRPGAQHHTTENT
jgi:hypothetical protein